ncbi:MAG: substrate-binding domain-containing protein [Flavobacteriales bacterium]
MIFSPLIAKSTLLNNLTTVKNLVSKGVEMVIINQLGYKALVPTINATAKLGIPVVIVDNYIDHDTNYVTSILANNLGNGKLISEWIVKTIGDKKIKTALISCTQGSKVSKKSKNSVAASLRNNFQIARYCQDLDRSTRLKQLAQQRWVESYQNIRKG